MKGGLDAERAERVRCKQEDMERDRRNFEAMQVAENIQLLQCKGNLLSECWDATEPDLL